MSLFLASLSVALISFPTVFAATPRFSINKVCKKNDTKLDACYRNCVQALIPVLRVGIPELHVPPLEPLKLGDLVVQYEAGIVKFHGTRITARGGSSYELKTVKANLSNDSLEVLETFRFPKLKLEAEVNITVNFLNMNFRGKGPVYIVAEDINGNMTFKGKIVKKGGQNAEFVLTDPLDLKFKWSNYEMKLGRGFFKDPAMTEVFTAALNANKNDISDLVRPRIESITKEIIYPGGHLRLIPNIVFFCR